MKTGSSSEIADTLAPLYVAVAALEAAMALPFSLVGRKYDDL